MCVMNYIIRFTSHQDSCSLTTTISDCDIRKHTIKFLANYIHNYIHIELQTFYCKYFSIKRLQFNRLNL